MGEWEQVRKKTTKAESAVNAARRQGVAVDTQPKFGGGSNRQHVVTKSTAKLDRETEELKHETVPLDLGKLIMQSRQAKGLSQRELATKICEKPQIVNDYEAGRGIPNNLVIGKIERALGVKLRGKERGRPLPPPGKNAAAPRYALAVVSTVLNLPPDAALLAVDAFVRSCGRGALERGRWSERLVACSKLVAKMTCSEAVRTVRCSASEEWTVFRDLDFHVPSFGVLDLVHTIVRECLEDMNGLSSACTSVLELYYAANEQFWTRFREITKNDGPQDGFDRILAAAVVWCGLGLMCHQSERTLKLISDKVGNTADDVRGIGSIIMDIVLS